MLWECFLEPTYEWEEFNHTIHKMQDCFEVPFLKANYYLTGLYHVHETDVGYTLIGNTLYDQMSESDAARLRIAEDFEAQILTPVFGLNYEDLILDGVPAHSFTVDYSLVDAAGLFAGLDAAIGSGLLPIDGPTYDDLAAYITGHIADYDEAGLLRQDVIAMLVTIIDEAKAAAAS